MNCSGFSFKEQKINKMPDIGIGMIGLGYIGEAHLDGILRMPYIFKDPPAIPKLIYACDIERIKCNEIKQRYNFLDYCINWQNLIEDERVKIVYITSPNYLHAEQCIAASKAGKHIVCEKPLGLNSLEAKEILKSAKKTDVKNLCNFIFRMVPALAYAKQLLMEKKLGKIISFSATRLSDHLLNENVPITWRLDKRTAGSGVVGDLMSHIIDLARWLCGEPVSVMAINKIFINERPKHPGDFKKFKVDVEDDSVAILNFENGATGYLAASGLRSGRKVFGEVEINGELGTIYWNFEEMNKLYFYRNEINGFMDLDISGNLYPYIDKWQYPVTRIGFCDLFINVAFNIINSVVNKTDLVPMSATFDDGYKAAVICDAILKAGDSGKTEKVIY